MPQILRTDWVLFFTVVVMVCFGLVMDYSASSVVATLKFNLPNYYFLTRQAAWALASFALLMYLKRMDYKRLCSPTWAFGSLGVVLFLLAVVYFLDGKAHRWIRLGPLSLQPSELAKPALVIFLAWFVSMRLPALNTFHTLFPTGMVLTVVGVIVVLADLGTAIVLVATAAIVVYVAGVKWRWLALGMVAVLLGTCVAVFAAPYRLKRVMHFVDPEDKYIHLVDPGGHLKARAAKSNAPVDTGYQVRQSKIAFGSGGILGLGLMRGKQKLLFLPEAHTDFIYSVVGEELGLWGCAILMLGFLLIGWRGMRLFWAAPDAFGKYLALGATVCVVAQALINMSVVLGLGPTKGLPLPMISNGGSSLLATLALLGMLMSVSERA